MELNDNNKSSLYSLYKEPTQLVTATTNRPHS